MGSTRSHPLPPGIFVKMSSSSSEFDGWTDRELVSEINRLRELLKIHDESKRLRETRVDYETVVLGDDDDDEDDEDEEVRVLTEEEVQNDPEMTAKVGKVDHLRAHFC